MQCYKNQLALLVVLFTLTGCHTTSKSTSIKSSDSKSEPNSLVITTTENIKNTENYKDYSVSIIENCGQHIKSHPKAFSLFANYDGKLQNQNLLIQNFTGWNHTTNGNTTEWTNLKLPSSNYAFNTNANINSSCNNLATLDIVLVKKIADWNHQHANGFECNILDKGYKFGDIESLVFDVKINSAKTHIPSIERLKTIYANDVDDAVIEAMEDGKVNIGITLGDNTNLNATIIFELDQEKISDKWVRVIIPMHKLSCYQEKNYKKTPKTFEDLKNIIINRMLIVAETKSGTVLRANIKNWNSNVPETFKEMDLSFKKIEFQLK